MPLLYLGLVFAVIVLLLTLHRPLYQAILGGLLVTALLFRMPLEAILGQTARVFRNWSSL